jgi:hypothetical protein
MRPPREKATPRTPPTIYIDEDSVTSRRGVCTLDGRGSHRAGASWSNGYLVSIPILDDAVDVIGELMGRIRSRTEIGVQGGSLEKWRKIRSTS